MIEINGQQFGESEIKALAKAGVLNIGQKNDPAGSLDATVLQGPYPGPSGSQFGIFSDGTVYPDRFSAMPRTRTFMGALGMPMRNENYQALYEILTGQTAGGTSNAVDFCGNPPEVGDLKTCRQTYAWGSYYVKTKLNQIPAMGMLKNRAEVPAQILNAAPANRSPFIPDAMYSLTDPRSQLRHELYKIGVDMERTSETVVWQGQAGTDNNRTGWFEEFAGLDALVKTGHTDSVTGLACSAADSVVETYGVNMTDDAADGRNIVETLTDLYYAVSTRAEDVGMAGTQFAFVMPKEMFRALTEVWACNYATYRCDGSQGNVVNREGMEIQRLRTGMMSGRYLLIDGVSVPVLFSDGIALTQTGANSWGGDIFILPLSYAGMRTLYLEYFPMDNPYAAEFVNFQGGDEFMTLNNGMYFVTNRNNGNCREYHFSAMFRLILRTPFLAARLDDVYFSYFAQTRRNDPSLTYWYDDGGVTYR